MLIGLKEGDLDSVRESAVYLSSIAVKVFQSASCFDQIEKFGEYKKDSFLEGPLGILDTYVTKKSERAKQRLAYSVTEVKS